MKKETTQEPRFDELTQFEQYRKLDETIAKFKDGERQYRKSALFNMTVQQLARGADPYEVISTLIQASESTTSALQHHIVTRYPFTT